MWMELAQSLCLTRRDVRRFDDQTTAGIAYSRACCWYTWVSNICLHGYVISMSDLSENPPFRMTWITCIPYWEHDRNPYQLKPVTCHCAVAHASWFVQHYVNHPACIVLQHGDHHGKSMSACNMQYTTVTSAVDELIKRHVNVRIACSLAGWWYCVLLGHAGLTR